MFFKVLHVDFSLFKYAHRTAIALSEMLDSDKIEVDIVYLSNKHYSLKIAAVEMPIYFKFSKEQSIPNLQINKKKTIYSYQ